MDRQKIEKRLVVAACVFALATLSGFSAAQTKNEKSGADTRATAHAPTARQETAATKHVNAAATVVQRMDREPRMKELLQEAKGVFIIPTYGRAALAVGGSGGAGVLLVKRDDDTWSDPAFYNTGGISVGAQAGVEGGPIAMILNNEKAVDRFMQKNSFSLNADAGLTVVNWAKTAESSVGRGDVTVWAGTKGLFGNVVTVGVNDIRFNQNLTNAYYHQTVSAEDVVNGKFNNPQADTLKRMLAASSPGKAGSSSGGGSAGTSSGKQ
ncbi:MAG: lipid-binding SYLF domain-containing protein [Burkholderiaceae bacterium]